MMVKEDSVSKVEKLQALAAKIQERNQDLSPEEAEKIADEISRDAIDRLVKKGQITFTGTENCLGVSS